jgi:hypothetical protein
MNTLTASKKSSALLVALGAILLVTAGGAFAGLNVALAQSVVEKISSLAMVYLGAQGAVDTALAWKAPTTTPTP